MERTDAMIMLMTLYNRLSETGISKNVLEKTFTDKVKELQMCGHIQQLDAKVAMAYLIPSYREKEVQQIKKEAIKEYQKDEERENSGYSKAANLDTINSILNGALKNTKAKDKGKDVDAWKPKPVEYDPCYHPSFHAISSC